LLPQNAANLGCFLSLFKICDIRRRLSLHLAGF
jgi:hypothetical protein